MLTWDMILTENRATSREAGYLIHAASCSPFLTRLLARDALLLNDLLENLQQAYLLKDMQTWFSRKKIDDEIALKQRLRQLRQHVLARTIVRDINGLADFDEVVTITSALAELTIQQAIAFHQAQLITQYGVPKSLTQAPQSLIVVGMGKLGGGELNVSSDIDLIFAYEQDGQTDGAESISNQMFFTKLAKKVIAALDEVTEDGFVFRVDMRLRPFGSEGALVSSLDALEDYYQNYGREWERYAWIKGRVVDGPSAAINKLLKPFIFRKYLDFNAYSAMRDLKLQIQRDVVQRGLEDNIKLGRGGIREIEFIVQLFQLIRGGQDADLQIKPTLQTLKVLGDKGLISQTAVAELTQSYIFLRNLEHRLMYVDDQQTQDLPQSLETKQRIVKMMQMHDWDTFIQQLNQHRAIVQSHFDATFSDTQTESHAEAHAIWQGVTPADVACEYLYQSGYQDAMETLRRLNTLHAGSRYQQLPQQSKTRLDRLMPLVIHQAAQTSHPDDALVRTINLLENICRRASYLALLAEFPDALALVVKLCAASPWLAQYLSAHPILLDELLNTQNLYAVPDFAVLKSELEKKMQQLEGDVEAQMDAMRHFKHSTVLRFAAQDVAAQLPLERLSDYLSDLAQVILQVSLQTIWQSLRFKHQETPQFAIIGYGKLGGKELGYLSDLDIIFLYDDAHPDAAEIYAKFAQRINNWFNSLTNAGLLYETDLQLRPDGNSGLLVSSVEAFTDYQLNKAWVWEHQAITRARFIAGDSHVGASFASVRHKVLMQIRDEKTLKNEVIQMRQKMHATHKPHLEWFDVKHDAGGIIDVEFIVQYLVLRYANVYMQLIENIGNIALLHTLAALGLIEQTIAEKVANAYRAYRIIIHSTRLQEKEAKVSVLEVEAHRAAVLLLWQQVLLD
ncbi:MAG: bifunctional [glutamate--ammonia ligase]-adenylyl-L-tyrosine phosphorylase/[glutamate--ammonia-ligase] adenylyltransferase [Methylophilus sp.]|nr:bifunctional [glutamate--ammonia ligase]-adenylyl-L-tyrosine phosphorylase/[glutamate--ammonia-ligase] adenylyltransferase [Methylophilus sp.]